MCTHLVLRKGIIMPAAVATKSSTTCNIVNTTLMSFTTRARAFELSMPSTVTYCCCDICSIFDICVGGKMSVFFSPTGVLVCVCVCVWLTELTLVWQFSSTSLTSRSLSSLWYCTFSSMSAIACFRFSISFCNKRTFISELNTCVCESVCCMFYWAVCQNRRRTWCNSVKSLICSSSPSARYRSLSSVEVKLLNSFWLV